MAGIKKPGIKKKARTIYFTDEILKGIEIALKTNKTGENKNQIVLNCIAYGLKELYKIEI